MQDLDLLTPELLAKAKLHLVKEARKLYNQMLEQTSKITKWDAGFLALVYTNCGKCKRCKPDKSYRPHGAYLFIYEYNGEKKHQKVRSLGRLDMNGEEWGEFKKLERKYRVITRKLARIDKLQGEAYK